MTAVGSQQRGPSISASVVPHRRAREKDARERGRRVLSSKSDRTGRGEKRQKDLEDKAGGREERQRESARERERDVFTVWLNSPVG